MDALIKELKNRGINFKKDKNFVFIENKGIESTICKTYKNDYLVISDKLLTQEEITSNGVAFFSEKELLGRIDYILKVVSDMLAELQKIAEENHTLTVAEYIDSIKNNSKEGE